MSTARNIWDRNAYGKKPNMIQYSSKAVENLNLDRQNSHALGKCCHENNSNTTANSSINANRNDTGNDVNIFVSNLTPKTIGLSIPSKIGIIWINKTFWALRL